MTVMVLFLIGISIMTAISSTQVKNRTEENVVESSGSLIKEMGFAIENYLGQYEKGLAQLSTSPLVTDFSSVKGDEPADDSLPRLNKAFENFMELYVDSSAIYYSLPTKETFIMPSCRFRR